MLLEWQNKINLNDSNKLTKKNTEGFKNIIKDEPKSSYDLLTLHKVEDS